MNLESRLKNIEGKDFIYFKFILDKKLKVFIAAHADLSITLTDNLFDLGYVLEQSSKIEFINELRSYYDPDIKRLKELYKHLPNFLKDPSYIPHYCFDLVNSNDLDLFLNLIDNRIDIESILNY